MENNPNDAIYEIIDEQGNPSQQEESLLGSGLRNLLRTDVRIGESLLGTPGDIQSGLLGLGNLGLQKLTGKRPLPEKILPLPTTEEIRGITSKASQYLPEEYRGYVEPQTPQQESFDEFSQDLTSL